MQFRIFRRAKKKFRVCRACFLYAHKPVATKPRVLPERVSVAKHAIAFSNADGAPLVTRGYIWPDLWRMLWSGMCVHVLCALLFGLSNCALITPEIFPP